MSPEDGFGRVTNPERFGALHHAALAEVNRLDVTYDVAQTDRVDPVGLSAKSWLPGRAVTLTPAGGGAPVTIALTSFPGVAIHAGCAYDTVFPVCGCDGCDEQPGDLIENLREVLADVVAGGLIETRRHRLLRSDEHTIRLESADGGGYSQTGSGDVDSKEDRGLPVGVTRWPAWKRRERLAD
jgi:hypothetical protein